MDRKPSFLERLTGALDKEEPEETPLKVSDDDNEDETEEIEIEDASEEMEEKKPADKSKPAKNDGKKAKKPQPMTASEENEDWLPDAEGQLTIDVYQTPTEIVIKSTIAGVDPSNLDITVTNDMVTIKGKREKDEVISSGDYYYQECYWGSFSRSVILPVDIEADKAEAGMKNGILTIRLPKIEKVKTKKLKVSSK